MTEYQKRTFTEWLLDKPRQPVTQARSEEMLPGVIPPALQSRSSVTLNESLSISAVYAAVNILTTWTAQMSLGVYKNGEELPAPSIISQPDSESTQYAFVRKTVSSLALTGNAYWYVTRRQSDGVPLSLEVLNPLAMAVEVDANGRKVFRYTGYSQPKQWTTHNVIHIMTFEVPGRVTGLSPLEAGGANMAGVLALRKYASDWFGDTGGVRQHFSYAFAMDDEQREEWARRIKAQKALNNGDIYTSGDTSVENLSLTPSDAMYTEQQAFSITEIARWFGIPPYLILASVDGNSMTYSNLQTDARLFVTSTLMGYMRPIEEAFSGLLPRGQVVRFNTETLLRADTRDRYEAYNLAIEGGYMTPEWVAAKEGLPPIEEKETPQEQPAE